MFSYRHAFHAGNHADVLKHFVLIQLLQYMNRKDAAYTYIDTHAGAGVYQLDGEYAAKSGESATGIAPLWERDDMPEALAEYVNLVKRMNPSGKLRFYPGSPYCAEQVAREQDRLRMFEMHPADFKLLTDNFRKLAEHAAAQGQRPSVRGQRALVTRADGFQSLKALLPPPSRRAVVLCDPPYEDKQDYRKVTDMLHEALKRFPGGTYAVWYPILQRIEARNFAERLKHLPGTEWLNVSLTIRTPGPDGFGGLHSSGMFIINPPYTLEATLKQVMPYLVDVLGVDAGATFVLESGLAATTPRLTASPHADGPRAAASPRGSGQRAGSGRPQGGSESGRGGQFRSESRGVDSRGRGQGGWRGGDEGRAPRSGAEAGAAGASGNARGGERAGVERPRSDRAGGDRPGRPGMEDASRGRPGSERMRDARPSGSREGGYESRTPRGGSGRPGGMGGSGTADGGGARGRRPAVKPFAGTGRTAGPRSGPRKG
jgi:23S rRNA (adenine2030-N6)-methyltransferase